MRVEEFCAFVRGLETSKDYIMACLLGLSPIDIEIYNFLARKGKGKNKGLEVTEIANALGRDRSTIQRGLQRLVTAGICNRIKKEGKRGKGYKYVYMALPEKAVKKRLLALVEEWRSGLIKAIKEAF